MPIETGARGREEGLRTWPEAEALCFGCQKTIGRKYKAGDHASCLSRDLASVKEGGEVKRKKGADSGK